MTAQEWEQLTDLLAIIEEAVKEACVFLDAHMKRDIKARLCRAGVPNYVEEAYQDCLVNLISTLCRVREIDLFEAYLHRVVMSAAKKYRPRTVTASKLPQQSQEKPESSREIGSKTITVDGEPHFVRVFAPNPPEEQVRARTAIFEPCSDAAIANSSETNRPDYPRKIDVWSAMAELPIPCAEALRLTIVEGYTSAAAAEILGCTIKQVRVRVQKGTHRMRDLLPGYSQNGHLIVQVAQAKADSLRAKRSRHLSRSLGRVALRKAIRISRTVSKGLLYVTGTRLAPEVETH